MSAGRPAKRERVCGDVRGKYYSDFSGTQCPAEI
jgi:hypothetical protein